MNLKLFQTTNQADSNVADAKPETIISENEVPVFVLYKDDINLKENKDQLIRNRYRDNLREIGKLLNCH